MDQNVSPFDWSHACIVAGPCIRPGGITLTEKALKVCDLNSDSAIVDIGCGVGGTLEYLKERGFKRLSGLDYSAALIDMTVPRDDGWMLSLGRAEWLPFKEQSFHGLFCECVLSLVDNRNQAVREFVRVLDKDGFLVVSDLYQKGASDCGHENKSSCVTQSEGLLSKKYLIDFLTSEGFSILLWEDHKAFLKEYAARLILAGESLPFQGSTCGKGQNKGRLSLSDVSYFLLVAQKMTTSD